MIKIHTHWIIRITTVHARNRFQFINILLITFPVNLIAFDSSILVGFTIASIMRFCIFLMTRLTFASFYIFAFILPWKIFNGLNKLAWVAFFSVHKTKYATQTFSCDFESGTSASWITWACCILVPMNGFEPSLFAFLMQSLFQLGYIGILLYLWRFELQQNHGSYVPSTGNITISNTWLGKYSNFVVSVYWRNAWWQRTSCQWRWTSDPRQEDSHPSLNHSWTARPALQPSNRTREAHHYCGGFQWPWTRASKLD